MIIKRESGIILSLDITDKEELLDIAKDLSKYVDAIKIGNPTLYMCGINIIKEIKKVTNLPVIGDFKFVDVPFITLTNISILLKNNIDGIMLWGSVGRETLRRANKLIKKDDNMLFVITSFTCSDAQKYTDQYWQEFVNFASEFETFGIQVPATKPHRIIQARNILKKEQKIICCGIGAQGPAPSSAIQVGADWE
ncbi:Orotidine 5'-phosphate decarboxylase [Beggiatoa sp. PS]|nr:Orotidine 5'-phosphate decarboxylase [Beggiatoa sp. PS]